VKEALDEKQKIKTNDVDGTATGLINPSPIQDPGLLTGAPYDCINIPMAPEGEAPMPLAPDQ